MIEQFNLLDKVWYVNDINTKEVTITSHIYLNDIGEKVVTVIVGDSILEVKPCQLYYTEKEAYQCIMDTLEYRISDAERALEVRKNKLSDLNKLRNDVLDVLDELNKN